MLLSREEFHRRVFARDSSRCVFCGDPATEAHHIMDRKLFWDGGYYEDNGASVCNPCHMRCELTDFSVELVRDKCGITSPVLPQGFKEGHVYDKWGNEYLEDGRRIRGPLFHDTAVQKLLKRELWRYEPYSG